MKGHMTDGLRRGFAFHKDDGHVIVAHCHAIFELELFPQTEYTHEPLRTAPRMTDREPEVTDRANSEWAERILDQ
jgi:hypothetical protein